MWEFVIQEQLIMTDCNHCLHTSLPSPQLQHVPQVQEIQLLHGFIPMQDDQLLKWKTAQTVGDMVGCGDVPAVQRQESKQNPALGVSKVALRLQDKEQ